MTLSENFDTSLSNIARPKCKKKKNEKKPTENTARNSCFPIELLRKKINKREEKHIPRQDVDKFEKAKDKQDSSWSRITKNK